MQQGLLFAAGAARGSLLGLVGVAAFCLVYARASMRLRWPWCLLFGWSSFAVVTMLISRLSAGPVAALVIAVAALLGARRALPVAKPTPPFAGTPRRDLPLRMLSAWMLVFALASSAERGSSLSGILTPFPVATAILAGFTHARRGSAACVEFLRAYVPGLCGFATFSVVLALALPQLSIASSFGAALVMQLALQTWLFRRM